MNIKQRIMTFGFLVIGLLISSCGPSVQINVTATNVPPTETVLPTNTLLLTPIPTVTLTLIPALTNWNGIPIIPGAITGQEDMGDYQFTINASPTVITTYYQQEMAKLGWKLRPEMMASIPTDLAFSKGNAYEFFKIIPEGDFNIVAIHPFKQ